MLVKVVDCYIDPEDVSGIRPSRDGTRADVIFRGGSVVSIGATVEVIAGELLNPIAVPIERNSPELKKPLDV